MANTLDRLLLYTVGGERYATPLDDLREVLDTPWRSADGAPPVVHGHAVDLHSLSDLLGIPGDTHGVSAAGDRATDSQTRPLFVVELEDAAGAEHTSAWVGLVADRVQGMLRADTVVRVPDAVSQLPEGSIMGAVILPGSSHGKPAPEGGGTDAREHGESMPISDLREGETPVEPGAVVLLLDLRKLAAWVSGPDREV